MSYTELLTVTINNGTFMKTNKLPQSGWSDSQEAGSQSKHASQSNSYYLDKNNMQRTGYASNDASYNHNKPNDEHSHRLAVDESVQDCCFEYKSTYKRLPQQKKSAMVDSSGTKNKNNDKPLKASIEEASKLYSLDYEMNAEKDSAKQKTHAQPTTDSSYKDIPERVFMNGLIKHTGIALAIIIPLAAFSAYAATPTMPDMAANAMSSKTTTETLSIDPSAIIHKSANTPTTVDSVDLTRYAGTWYEIGRLPMYFQRNCASDVTANYAQKSDGSGITVTNKCVDEDGADITAEGLAKTADDTGSKLKVTFLPSWIRWLPVGRADYWVLARDADYKTALVGTPDKDYLWLLARSPNVSQETYSKYRQIAEQQGYDLKEFKLTPQTNQTVSLVP